MASCLDGFYRSYEHWTAIHEAGHAALATFHEIQTLRIWIAHACVSTDQFEHGRVDYVVPLYPVDIECLAAGVAAELVFGRRRRYAMKSTDVRKLRQVKPNMKAVKRVIAAARMRLMTKNGRNTVEDLAKQLLLTPPISVAHAQDPSLLPIPVAAKQVHLLRFF